MKRLIFYLIFLLIFVGCATKQKTVFPEAGEVPHVFCKVAKEPDPLLLGAWEATFYRAKFDATKRTKNYVKYRLIKYDDKYALYFHRTWRSGRKKIREWKNWDINGQEITAGYGVRIFVQDGGVYFTIRGLDEPVRMTRMAD